VEQDDNGPGEHGFQWQATERQCWGRHLRMGTQSRQQPWLHATGEGELQTHPIITKALVGQPGKNIS